MRNTEIYQFKAYKTVNINYILLTSLYEHIFTICIFVTAVELVNKFGMNTVSFDVSRPFMFFIEDKLTGTVIFIGKVVNPESHGKPIVSGTSPLKPPTKQPITSTSSDTTDNLPGNTNNTKTE